jgi:DNA-binding GntR family transcriptional regulator
MQMSLGHDAQSTGSTGARFTDVASQTARALFTLRDWLMRGEFAPGERMAELPLVARLGVSRTPIRLALERLAHMGLLTFSAAGGFTVRGYSLAEALDAIEIRGVLEGTAGLARPDDTLAAAQEHHRSIVEAIAGRQGTRAESPAREHAFLGRRVLLMALADRENVNRVPGASLISSAHLSA